MRDCRMYDLRVNEDYQCVCEESNTKVYLCLVLKKNHDQYPYDEIEDHTLKRVRNRRRVARILFEGVKWLSAILAGAFLHAFIGGWIF